MSHPLWSLIPKVYCLNCAHSDQRWTRMQTRLVDLPHGVLERWEALLPQDDVRLSNIIQEANVGIIQQRVMANALSHRDIWQASEQTHPTSCVLILEDDVFFQRDWIAKTYNVLQELDRRDPNWDMLQLNAQGFISWNDHGLRQANNLLLAGAYVLSPRGRAKLLAQYSNTDPHLASDYRLAWLQEQNHCYFHFPFLAIQECWDSVIAGNETSGSQAHTIDMYEWQKINYKPNFDALYDWPEKPQTKPQ